MAKEDNNSKYDRFSVLKIRMHYSWDNVTGRQVLNSNSFFLSFVSIYQHYTNSKTKKQYKDKFKKKI
jgi:hypothetical protein